MKGGFAKYVLAAALTCACLWLASLASAQTQEKTAHPVFPPSTPAAQPANGGRGAPPPELVAKLKKDPTPRTADGHPDLTGFWGNAGWGYGVQYGKLSADGKTYDIENPVGTAERPSAVAAAAARAAAHPPAPPPYKPEYAAKAKEMSEHYMKYDPVFFCGMSGFPRLGAPTEIVQTPDRLVFLYQPSEQLNSFRVIPIDGRKHDPSLDPSYLGDSIGHWDGDTMVIDVVNFTDETWISREAPIHSDQMHVVETLTREGDTIRWGITIDDPKVFTKPMTQSKILTIGVKGGHALEELPCKEHDAVHIPGR